MHLRLKRKLRIRLVLANNLRRVRPIPLQPALSPRKYIQILRLILLLRIRIKIHRPLPLPDLHLPHPDSRPQRYRMPRPLIPRQPHLTVIHHNRLAIINRANALRPAR